MTVSITRSGGRTAPPDKERLEVGDDGSFTMWRSVRSPVVGRFAGMLPESDAARLRALAEAAAAAEVPPGKQLPGAPTETVVVDGASLRTGSSNEPGGPWGELIGALRPLLRSLVSQPRAAIALEVAEGGASARLAHRGDTPVGVDLTGLSVRTVVWRPGWENGGEWAADAPGPVVEAGPGWAHDLPFGHGLTIGNGDALHAFARFGLVDGGARIAALASLDPSPAP